MLQLVRNSRGGARNAPAAFIILKLHDHKPDYCQPNNRQHDDMMRPVKRVGPIGIAQSPFPHKRIASIQKSARRNRPGWLVRSAKETLALRTAGIVVVLPAASDRK